MYTGIFNNYIRSYVSFCISNLYATGLNFFITLMNYLRIPLKATTFEEVIRLWPSSYGKHTEEVNDTEEGNLKTKKPKHTLSYLRVKFGCFLFQRKTGLKYIFVIVKKL